jgi:hypothetical protein
MVISVLLLAVVVTGALANEVMQATTCHVPAGRVIAGDLYVVCQDLTIDGQVEGALIGLAMTARISGKVDDDIYLVARNLTIDGTLGDDVVALAGVLSLEAGGDWQDGRLIAVAAHAVVQSGVQIPDGLTMVAYQLLMDGVVARDLLFAGEALTIGGQVDGEVNARTAGLELASTPMMSVLMPLLLNVPAAAPGLRVTDGATVGGDVAYTSTTEGWIGGDIGGDVRYTQAVNPPTIEEFVAESSRIDALRAYFTQVAQEMVVLTLVGAVLLWLSPRLLLRPIELTGERVGLNMALGAGAIFLSVPAFVLVLVLGVLGLVLLLGVIRLDVLTVAFGSAWGVVTLGGGGLFYFVVVYIARVVTASALGSWLINRITQADLSIRQRILSITVGGGLIALLAALYPFGWVFNLISVVIGLGALGRALHRALHPPALPPMMPAAVGREAAVLSPRMPPPLVDTRSAPPGMENLPDGFTWWHDDE